MAKIQSKTKKNQPTQPIASQIVIRPPLRRASDVGQWRTALLSADFGRMKLLFDLYDDLLIDGVLFDAADKRIGAVTNSPLTFQDARGKDIQEITDLIDTMDFEELLKTVMWKQFWGRSGGEFDFSNGFNFNPIPFKHINLDNKMILIDEYDTEGIDYSTDDQILVLGRPREFGLFLKTAPYAIWKRGGFGDYAQWLEIFGMPQRVGKYSSYDPESRKTLVAAMEQAGAAPWIVIPKETDIETTKNTGTSGSGSVHNEFRKACNEELLITVLGQTMTTIDGSSRAQAYTHKKVEEGKNRADMRYVRRVLNTMIIPLLEKRGFPVKGGRFVFPEDSEMLTVTDLVSVCGLIDVPDSYLRDKYSIPVPKSGEKVARSSTGASAASSNAGGGEGDGGGGQNLANKDTLLPIEPIGTIKSAESKPNLKNLFIRLRDFFVAAPGSGANNLISNNVGADLCVRPMILSDRPKDVNKIIDIDKLFQQALKNIYAVEGVIDNAAEIDEKIFELTNAVIQHATESTFLSADVDWAKKNEAFTQQFKENNAVFSAFKSHEQTGKIVSLLTNEDGSLKSFSAFKNEALQIDAEYNKQWLQTEYNTAVRSARMAVNWKKFQEAKKLYPNLKYTPSRAANPRESHTEYYGCIWPMDDPIWDIIMPPSDWNCMCGVKQTDEAPTVQPEDWVQPEGDPVFSNNPGKTAKFVNTEATNYYLNTPEDKRAGIEAFALELLKQYS